MLNWLKFLSKQRQSTDRWLSRFDQLSQVIKFVIKFFNFFPYQQTNLNIQAILFRPLNRYSFGELNIQTLIHNINYLTTNRNCFVTIPLQCESYETISFLMRFTNNTKQMVYVMFILKKKTNFNFSMSKEKKILFN